MCPSPAVAFCVCLCTLGLLPDPRPASAAEASSQADPIWREAETRIDRYRRADVQIQVVDPQGRPVPQAEVRIEQQRHAFLFGCNVFGWAPDGENPVQAAYRRQFAHVFNFATLPFYWWSYERQQGQPAHERTEQIAGWCAAQGITCKGHPLAWNYGDPAWLPEDPVRTLELQLARITDCATRFRDTIGIWDVVNEATHFDRAELLRRAPRLSAAWKQAGQLEFTRRCFQAARQANPQATLLINDYRVDDDYARLIEKLTDAQGQALYDVIGIQSHQHAGTWDNAKIWSVCERFAKFGVPLHFTETTILSGQRGWELRVRGEAWETTEEGERQQAQEVERFYTMLYSHPAVEAITWWDFADLHAWQGAPAGFLRRDVSPKPAYQTLQRLIKEKWWTRHAATTDEQGRLRFRATLGQHRVTVKTAAGRTVQVDLPVVRDKDNELQVRLSP